MKKPLVYLVDDDRDLNEAIQGRFVSFGCDVKSFVSAQEILTVLTAQPAEKPDLILVDLNLGEGLSGFDLIKKVRNELKMDVPILILSGHHDQKEIAHGLEVGANDFIVKPPLREDFQEIISHYLTAEHLPEPIVGTYQGVLFGKGKAKLKFSVSIKEIHPAGLTLISDHLIKKGASFYLSGESLKKIMPSCEKVFVTVISSSIVTVADQKKYQMGLEVDASQVEALQQIRGFLNTKFAESPGGAQID